MNYKKLEEKLEILWAKNVAYKFYIPKSKSEVTTGNTEDSVVPQYNKVVKQFVAEKLEKNQSSLLRNFATLKKQALLHLLPQLQFMKLEMRLFQCNFQT